MISPATPADNQLEYSFSVAGIPLTLRFLPETLMPLSASLLAFEIDRDTVTADATLVEFVPDPPDIDLYQQRCGLQTGSVHMSLLGERLLFTCPTGQFLASRDFRQIWLWAPFEKTIDDNFDGYPWLQLIFWARISLAGGCYLHGAIVALEGRYVLLLGDSGAGKSTLSGLAVEAGFTRLTEENPFLCWHQERPWVCAAPWLGMSGPPMSPSGPLKAIFFLRHGLQNEPKLLRPQMAGRRLLGNARMFNWLPQTIPDSVALLDKTLGCVPVYDFSFKPDLSAIDALREVLCK